MASSVDGTLQRADRSHYYSSLMNTHLFPCWSGQREHPRPGEDRIFPGNNIGYFGPLRVFATMGNTAALGRPSCWGSSIGLEADGKIKGRPSLPPRTTPEATPRPTVLLMSYKMQNQLLYPGARSVTSGDFVSPVITQTFVKGCTWTSCFTSRQQPLYPPCFRTRKKDYENVLNVAPMRRVCLRPRKIELVTESIPETSSPHSVCGFGFDEVLALDWKTSSGIWSRPQLKDILEADKKRLPVLR